MDAATEIPPVRGSCHCGRVAFELDAPVTNVVECNCSICRRRGALWIGATEAQLRVVSGEDALDLRAIAVVPFDGEHRDEAAAAFLTRLRAPVGA